MRRERVRERNDSRYEQFEISPETIEQERRPAVCKQRQTDILKENYSTLYVVELIVEYGRMADS